MLLDTGTVIDDRREVYGGKYLFLIVCSVVHIMEKRKRKEW